MSLKINAWRMNMPLGLEECPFPLRDPFRIIFRTANLASPCCTRISVSDHTKYKFTRDGVFAQRQQLFILRLAISTFSGSDTNQQRIRCQLCSHPSNNAWSTWQETIVWTKFTAKIFIILRSMWKCRRIHRKRRMFIVWPIHVRSTFPFKCFFRQGQPSSH